MIKILRSSAGSGKTFNLAKTYIKLLLASDDRYVYRHILAVTFTNKATAEMKNRILKELDILAHEPEKSGYINEFAPLFGGLKAVREKAALRLKDILHDYSAFSVSTIDKFFQQALRAFARELGQFSYYQVELDKESLLHESVDRVLASVDEDNKELRKWLTDSLMGQIEEKGRFSLERSLYEVARRLKNDSLREELERGDKTVGKVFSREYLSSVHRSCTKLVKDYKEKVKNAAEEVFRSMRSAGLDAGDFSGNFKISKIEAYLSPIRGSVPAPTPAFLQRIDDSSKWFTKARQGLVPLAESHMQGPLNAFKALFTGQEHMTYRTAELLVSQVYNLGLASDIEREFAALQEEKSVICIDDSNITLRNIIEGSDAPFVYEKLGVRYENFLLDEFQDTSAIQWENFCPLLKESDSSGGKNLLVGDVKQSIYRWRGGDWRLLSGGVKETFPGADDGESLRENWRSQKAIVDFNNAFFGFAAQMLDRQCSGTSLIQNIYADAAQSVRSKDASSGYVRCSFFESSDWQLQETLESVLAAREAGAAYGQIAVLVRRNDQGSKVASYLLKNGIPVISDDSLKVKSSVTVRRLVSLLYGIGNEKDLINRYVADSLDIDLPSRYDSLYSLAEELLQGIEAVDPGLYSKEILYIQSFMDLLLAWTSANGNDLAGFLKYWDEEDAKIASPDDSSAVRVLTVHKSKGLEFPYVIFVFAGDEPLFDSLRTSVWCSLKKDEPGLESLSEGVFDIRMSGKISETYFGQNLLEEKQLQYIDNINTLYVAMTRAGKVLHIISGLPSKSFREAFEKRSGDYDLPVGGFTSMSDLLYWFTVAFAPDEGEPYTFVSEDHSAEQQVLAASFRSWPLRGRMKVGGEVRDRLRLRGIVLHKILSDVSVASDLPQAISRAISSGLIEESQRQECQMRLEEALDFVKPMGWFGSSSKNLNETGIIDTDGSLCRPDRVIISDDGDVTVIDYKFGEEHPGYSAQVSRYCRLFRKMGYRSVSGWLWYVSASKIVQVEGAGQKED